MTMIKRALLALMGLFSASCASKPPLQTVPQVDLPRFMGDWYVIAHIPYFLEKGKVGTLDRYALRPDGRIQNSYLFRRDTLDAPLEEWRGVAWVKNQSTNAEWRVRFVWPFSAKYFIVDLDPAYQWAVIGHPSRKLAWILARGTTMDEATYARLLQGLEKQGYDPASLAKVPQKAPD